MAGTPSLVGTPLLPVDRIPIKVVEREFIDYMTSMTTYQDPLRGGGGNEELEVSHALPVVV